MASSGGRRNPILGAATTKNMKRPPDPEAAMGSSFGGGGAPASPVSRFGCTPALVVVFFMMAGLAVLFGLAWFTLDHRLRPLEVQRKTAADAEGFVIGAAKSSPGNAKRKAAADSSSVPEIDFNALLYGGNKPPAAADINESGRNAAAAAVKSGLPGASALTLPALPPNVRTNYYFFEVPEPDNYEDAERQGVRIPADADDKTIPDLSLDGLLHMSVCCRVDPNTQTCPNSNQIGVVIRAVPETGNHYLRVAVHNKAYYDVPCVFFWMSVNDATASADATPRLPERQAPRKK